MLSKNKTIIPLFCIIFAGWVNMACAAKSVFIISNHNNSVVEAFKIDANHVEFQGIGYLFQGTGGAVGIDVWPTKELMFVTYEGTRVISWSSTNTLQNVGEFNTGISGDGLAGIIIDQNKEKIFVAKRGTNLLYVYSYDDVNNTLISNGSHTLNNIGQYGIFGLALDEANNLLYATDGTKTVRVYDTNNWGYIHDINIVVDTNNRPATGITVDPVRGYLYTCGYNDTTNNDSNYLVRTDTNSPYTSTEVKIKTGTSVGRGIGLDVDTTGLVYCTTTRNDFRVYDSNLILQDTETNSGINGTAGVAVGGSCQLNQHVRNITNTIKDVNYSTIQLAITDANNNDTLVAWPGTYIENVNLGSNSSNSKLLTIQSFDPEDPLIVSQTIIRVDGGYAVTFTDNNSTVNGFTITNGSEGVHCSGSSSPTVINCLIRDNIYGVFCYNLSAPTIANCIIEKNLVRGICCSYAKQVKIINNWIVNNGNNGYGIYVESTTADVIIRNNTISGNYTGIYRSNSNDPNISNCIIWKNTRNNFSGTECNNVNYSCINSSSTGSYSGRDNITTDPCFVAIDINDFHLKAGSLCIDAGDPNFIPEPNEPDIDGDERILDGNGDMNPTVDMGADEYRTADFNYDGIVNFKDFAFWANVWQTSPAGSPYDLNNDSSIDFDDLEIFADNWLIARSSFTFEEQMQQSEPEALEHFSSMR